MTKTKVAPRASTRKIPSSKPSKRPSARAMPSAQRAPSDRLDLAAAVSAGFVLLPDATCATVRLEGRVIRFDPALPDAERAAMICGILASEAIEQRSRAEAPAASSSASSTLGTYHRVRQAIREGETLPLAPPLARRAAVMTSAVMMSGASGPETARALTGAVWRVAFKEMEGSAEGGRLRRIALVMDRITQGDLCERDAEDIAKAIGEPFESDAAPDVIACTAVCDLMHCTIAPVWEIAMEAFHHLEEGTGETAGAASADRTADALTIGFLERLALLRLAA